MSSDGVAITDRQPRPLWFELVRLARPQQWLKSGFVVLGPFYSLQDSKVEGAAFWDVVWLAFWAAAAFSLASSGCYVFNDLADVERDRVHPRKRHRPLARGTVATGTARAFGLGLFLAGGLCLLALPWPAAGWVGLLLALHVGNVLLYSAGLKRVVIVDVMSLSLGFVLRVMAGCAAVGTGPSTWLLNVTFFLSMFLAFGKRLGERRTMGTAEEAALARSVQLDYSDELLRMVVVVTGVATLVTYAGYVQVRAEDYHLGFNLLWLTVLPATYVLIRCITLLERGVYDDPTELVLHDAPCRVAGGLFVAMTLTLVGLVAWTRLFEDGLAVG
ncbi:MAG: decaprenyl-phosphate phosphoribosyltransferase [Phycisphaerales bacterium]